MRRRDCIALLGSAAAWPVVARGQQPGVRKRRLGVLIGLSEDDPAGKAELAAFMEHFDQLGWIDGLNINVDYRWSGTDRDSLADAAKQLVALGPDVLFGRATPVVAALLRETRDIPVVFVVVAEPVSSGLVKSLASPGGNATGFTNFQASVGGKWVDLLKTASPPIERIALLYNPETAPYAPAFLDSANSAAHSISIDFVARQVRNDAQIEEEIGALARQGAAGLVTLTDSFITAHGQTLIDSAASHRVPALYANHSFTRRGGLMAYAVDYPDLFRRAASYVDRILKGDKPGDMPVQQPTKFELSINVVTAKTLGLDLPPRLLAVADEVIE
jgi:putative ABC transport system substrate-binding protein